MVRKNKMLKAVLVAIGVTIFMVGGAGAVEGIDLKNYKNVIVLIPDGCDETVQTVARWYKGEDLQVDKMVGGRCQGPHGQFRDPRFGRCSHGLRHRPQNHSTVPGRGSANR